MVITRFFSSIPTDGLSLVDGKYVVRSRVMDGITLSTYFFPEEDVLSDLFLEKATEYIRSFPDLLIPYLYKNSILLRIFSLRATICLPIPCLVHT
jgi:hypothetical protein